MTGMHQLNATLFFFAVLCVGLVVHAQPQPDSAGLRAVAPHEFVVKVNGTLASHGKRRFEAAALTDKLLWSAWASPQAEEAWIEVRFPITRYIRQLQILTGDAADGRTWKRSQRIKSLRVHHEGGITDVKLTDSRNLQAINFEDPIVSSWLRLEVRDTYGKGPVAISELQLLEPEDVFALKPGLRLEIQAQVKRLRGAATRQEAAARLESIGAPAMAWLVPLLTDKDPVLRMEVTKMMTRTKVSHVAPRVRQQLKALLPDKKASQSPAEWSYVRSALRYLEEIHDPDSAPTALALAKHHAWGEVVQEEALRVLASCGDREVLPLLQKAIRGREALARLAAPGFATQGKAGMAALNELARDSAPEMRRRAAWALVGFGPRWPTALADKLLHDPDPSVRGEVLSQLGPSAPPHALESLLEASDDASLVIRLSCAEGLAYFSEPKAQARLVQMAMEPDPLIRRAALVSLEKQGLSALESLASLVTGARELYGRLESPVASSLRRVTLASPVKAFPRLRALLNPSEPTLSQILMNAIATCDEPGHTFLLATMRGDDTRMAFYARRGLETQASVLGGLLAGELAPSRTQTMDAAVLSRYLSVAAQTRDPKLVEALAYLAQDTRPRVRADLMRALRNFPFPNAQALLLQGLRDPWRDTREQAAVALGEQRHGKAVPDLMRLVEDNDPVILRAIWALGRMGDQSVLPLLHGLLSHPRSTVRQYACVALGKLGDETSQLALMMMESDEDEMVRFQARRAISRLE